MAVCEGFIWKRPDLFGLARIGFSRAAAVQAQALRRTPSLVSFSPSGSRWLSLQGLSEMGAPTLVSLRTGFPGPSMRLHLTNLVVSAAPHSAPALPPPLSPAGLSLLQGALTSVNRAPGRGLPRPDPGLLTQVQGQPPGGVSLWQSGYQ